MRPTDVRPFVPTGNTITLAATSTGSFTSAITGQRADNVEIPGTMLVCNEGAKTAFVKQSAGVATAASTDVPILAGASRVLEMKADTDHINAIFATSGGNIYVTPGQGGI